MRLFIRCVEGEVRLGPGKIQLLELIDTHGSISEAARAMNMSYRRAWLLIDELNHLFKRPLVVTRLGGSTGGGAELTSTGRSLLQHYRAMETEAHAALSAHLDAFDAALAKGRPRRTASRSENDPEEE